MELRTNIILVILAIMMIGGTAYSQEMTRLVNLRGGWKFTIGDDMNWADPNYNEKGWDIIRVPSSWEDEGYNGYNGYAWYRNILAFQSLQKIVLLPLNSVGLTI